MDPINIFILTVALANLFLGFLFLFHKEKKQEADILFTLLIFNVFLWSISMMLFRAVTDPYHIETALRILYLVPLFIPVLFWNFVIQFPDRPSIFLKYAHYFLIFAEALVMVYFVWFTDLFVVSAWSIPEGEKGIQFGWMYTVYILHFILFFGAAFYKLLQKLSSFSKGKLNIQKQLFVLFVGTLLSSAVALISNLTLPWIGFYELNWLGNIFTVFFIGSIFYAVLRYQLLDIKVIATEVFTFVILAMLIVQLLLTSSFMELLIKTVVLLLVTVFSFLLIKGVYKEIEARERIEKLATELAIANEHLRDLDKQKTEFVSIASHQLRTPLTAIKGYASMVLEGSFGKVSKSAKNAVERIFESSQQLVVIIDDFLNITHIEQGRMHYEFATVEMRGLLKGLVDEMKPRAEEVGLDIAFQVKGTGKFNATADYGKIKQVLSNLIDNAIKYTPQGKITVSLEKDEKRRKIITAISDTGIGISEQTKNKLFQKFVRDDGASKRNTSGSGLGLYVAKEIVKAHKGDIWIESKGEGEGATFFVELLGE